MSYSKEQTQTMALLVLVGLIIAVGSYMGLIKPNLGRVSHIEANLQKWSTQLDEQRLIIKQNRESLQRDDTLQARTAELEAQLRHGLFAGRLTACFEQVRADHGFEFRYQHDLEHIDPLNEGRYYELSNVYTILACPFFEVCRFIQVLETDNPGIRIGDLEIRAHDASAPDGLVDAKLEVRLVGFKDGRDDAWVSGSQDTLSGGGRNPFAPPGVRPVDPNASLKERLKLIEFNGTLGQSALIKPSTDKRAVLVKAGQVLPFYEGMSVQLVRFSNHTLIVRHQETDTYYKLTLYTSGENAGQVEQVEEIQQQ
jgi:hypothetical protein